MKIEKIFKSNYNRFVESGGNPNLSINDCVIENINRVKGKDEDFVKIKFKRKIDGEEGTVYFKKDDIRENYKNLSVQVIDWICSNNNILGITLEQLYKIETGIEFNKVSQ